MVEGLSKIQFSVIIATKDRPESLHACLESFRSLQFPEGQWELIIVNDGGGTSFNQISHEQRETLPLHLLHTSEPAGPASARNLGARAAKGTYLAFTDDDCRIAGDWLSQYERLFKTEGWDAAGGLTLNPDRENLASEAWSVLIEFLYHYRRDNHGNAVMLVSNNAAVRRDVFVELGGFDERFRSASNEDRELSYRLIAHGYRQTFCSDAKVWHHLLDRKPFSYLRIQFRYGRGAFHFCRAIREKGLTHAVTLEPDGHPVYAFALWRTLIGARKSPALIFLISLGQVAHRLGRIYETLRVAVCGTRE